jgi:hypothetical protein
MGNAAAKTGRRLGQEAARHAPQVRGPIVKAGAGPAGEFKVAGSRYRQACGAEAVPATIAAADELHAKDTVLSNAAEIQGRGVIVEEADYGKEQLLLFHQIQAVRRAIPA